MVIKYLILVIGIGVLLNNYRQNRLFSSSSIWLSVYLLIFVGYPIFSNKIFQHENEIDFYALIGIITFCYGSFISSTIRNQNIFSFLKLEKKFFSFDTAFRCYIFFLLLFFFFLIAAIGQNGLLHILKGSTTTKQIALDESLNISTSYLLFLHFLFICTLIIWTSQNKTIQKTKSIICFIVYILLSIIFSFTRLFLMCFIGCIFFIEMRNKSKKIQLVSVLLGGGGVVSLMVALNYIRCLGLGQFASLSNMINGEYVLESTDFGASYIFFDKLLDFESPYINPIVWFKALYSFIPRSIWISKPEPLSMQVLKYTDPSLAATGFSTAGNSVLGEGYAIMGVFGIAIFPFLWGFICTRLDQNYYNRLYNIKKISMADILYYIFCFFIIISAQRGDWSQYTVLILWFYILPMYCIFLFDRNAFSRK